MKLLPFAFLFLCLPAHAEECIDIKTCAKLMFDLKGQRYIWDTKIEETKFGSSPSVEITKDNADLIFTALLDQVGFARAPVGDGKTYRIVRGPDRKEMELATVDASADVKPVLPNTWDWMSMRYKTKTPEEVVPIEGAYRLHVPREARMQADLNGGILIVTGTVPLLREMYQTIRAVDKPLSPLARKAQEDWHKQDQQLQLARAHGEVITSGNGGGGNGPGKK